MPEPVETYEPVGIDYAWIMQMTFVITIIIGAPLVAALSWFVTLPTWNDRATFALGVGAVVWFLVSLGLYGYAAMWR